MNETFKIMTSGFLHICSIDHRLSDVAVFVEPLIILFFIVCTNFK